MAINLAENLLKNSNIHVVARLDLLAALLTYHSLVSFDHNLSLKYATEAVNIAINSKNEITPDSLNLAMNNMAYALIENKKLEEASHWINQLRTDLSSAEYIYATKGLFSLQSGNFEKAKELYLKAISITDSSRKDAFRMKMNYELGRYSFENSDYSHAKIYLKKVVQSKQAKDIWSLNELQFKASEFFGTIQRISFKA